jgi:general secretion pathway protein A
MYEAFYGLKDKPFHIVPNSSNLYLSNKHQSALTYLQYGLVESVGFILLTGEIGTGKTTLIRYILKKIDHDMEVAVIFNTNVTSDQLLNLILNEYELTPAADKAGSLDLLYQYLIRKYSEGKKVLLIIDEAQNLSDEALEEVRMLSNLQSEERMLLQIMLVGQPQLKHKLQDPRLTQLAQRIGVNYHLSALTREETSNYIEFRLERSGGKPDLFSPEAVELIYQASGGIPRTINLLCDSSLVYGFADEMDRVDRHIVEQVLQDKGDIGLSSTSRAQSPVHPEGSAPAALDKVSLTRLENAENDIRKLKIQVDWHIGEMEKRAESYKDELVLKFKELLFQERKRNSKLISELTRLRDKYDALQNPKELVRPTDPASFHWEDLEIDDSDKKSTSLQGFFAWLKS